MSVHVTARVWSDVGLPVREKIVLLKLADHANDEGRNAFPSVRRMARECGLSERSVQRALRELVRLGRIGEQTGADPTDRARHRPTTYAIIFAPGDTVTPGRRVTDGPAPGDKSDQRRVTAGPVPGDGLTPGRVTAGPVPGDGLTPEPSLNHQIEPSDRSVAAAAVPSRARDREGEIGGDDAGAGVELIHELHRGLFGPPKDADLADLRWYGEHATPSMLRRAFDEARENDAVVWRYAARILDRMIAQGDDADVEPVPAWEDPLLQEAARRHPDGVICCVARSGDRPSWCEWCKGLTLGNLMKLQDQYAAVAA